MDFRKIQFLISLLLASLMLAAAMDSGYAQNVGLRDLVQRHRFLEERINTARETLRSFNSKQGQELLQKAESIASEVKTRLTQSHLDAATLAMMRVRIEEGIKLAEQVINLAVNDTLQRLMNQLSELMRRAENEVIGGGNQEAERLVQEAKKYQATAETSHRHGENAKSMELLRVSILLVQKALKMAGTESTSANVDAVGSDRARFEVLAVRTRDAIDASNNQVAYAIYEQALKQANNAETAWRNGNSILATQLLNGAIKLLLRALDLASGTTALDENTLRNELATINGLIRTANEKISTSDEARKLVLLRRAETSANRAAFAIEQGKYALARLQLNLARGLLSRLYRGDTAVAADSEQRLAEELANLQEDIEHAKNTIMAAQNTEARAFLDLAMIAAQRAEANYKRGRDRAAVQQILIGQRFLSRAESADAGTQGKITIDQVDLQIARLRQLLGEVQNSLQDNPSEFSTELVGEATKMLARAEQMKSEQKFALAYEMADVGIEFLRKALQANRNE